MPESEPQGNYKNAVIYFMSGTGNSYRVSKIIEEEAERVGVAARVHSIYDADPAVEVEDKSACLVGLLFPTHGFTAPWHIIKFCLRLPRRRATHAFCIATRAGFRFGKLFTPGLSASGTLLIALIMALKGYKVRGVAAIDMPSNWYAFIPIQRAESIGLIIGRAKARALFFTRTLLSGKRHWLSWNLLYDTICAALLAPISLGYLLIGRFFLAKLFFANSKCDGCGVCEQNCPAEAIKLRGRNHPQPYWKYNCESCMRCASVCPKNAVEAGHSWAVALWLITSLPVGTYLSSALSTHLSATIGANEMWLEKPLQYAYLYSSLFTSYFLFYWLMKVPPFNWLFTWTTLTHLSSWGRYREPGTKLTSLKRKPK